MCRAPVVPTLHDMVMGYISPRTVAGVLAVLTKRPNEGRGGSRPPKRVNVRLGGEVFWRSMTAWWVALVQVIISAHLI